MSVEWHYGSECFAAVAALVHEYVLSRRCLVYDVFETVIIRHGRHRLLLIAVLLGV